MVPPGNAGANKQDQKQHKELHQKLYNQGTPRLRNNTSSDKTTEVSLLLACKLPGQFLNPVLKLVALQQLEPQSFQAVVVQMLGGWVTESWDNSCVSVSILVLQAA